MSYNCPHCKDKGAISYERQASHLSQPVNVYERCHCQPDIPSEQEIYKTQRQCEDIILFGTKQELAQYIATLHPYLQARFSKMYRRGLK